MSRSHRWRGEMRWWTCTDRTAATAPARQAFIAKFEREVDPEGTLPPAELAVRVDAARKAHYRSISLQRWRKRAGVEGGEARP